MRRAPLVVRLAASVAFTGLVAASCDRRVEEPVSTGSQATPNPGSTGSPSGQGAPERVLPPFVAAGRCVRQTPPDPERTAPPSPDPRCPPDPSTPPALRGGKVTFEAGKGRPVVDVDIAEKDADRQRGLMYRKAMPEGRGMIFRFEEKQDHTFWMHNTCIPLDMLFIDDDGLIVGIQENTPTMTDQTFSVGCPSRYVLELNAGWCRRHGVVAGQRVKLEGI
jgi:uncharacterized protein